jgi:acyl dehydratase
MQLSSAFVGTPLKDFVKAVEFRETMNYAASVGDHNVMYFDDEMEQGIVAPPLYCVATTWPILAQMGEYLESKDFPKDILLTQVHYTEHLEIHRLIKPGDILTVKGRIAAILPHRAGTHVVIRFDALDVEHHVVFTEHVGAMMRGVCCTDTGRGGDELPEAMEGVFQKSPVWKVPVVVDRLRPYIYDGCADIFFPIHTSKKFAHEVGLPGIILQGTATLAMAVKEVVDREAGGDPSRIFRIYCRFTDMVFPGTEIVIQLDEVHSSKKGKVLCFSVVNHKGKIALRGGTAVV